MSKDVELLLQKIAQGNAFQAQYIEKMKKEVMARRELENLEFLVRFFCTQGISVEQQAEAYLNFIQEIMEEQLYFRRNHQYSTHDYGSLCQSLYGNNQYMQGYQIALAIAEYIWSNHIYILRWYEDELKAVCSNKANRYLEVGCGLGMNLLHTMQVTNVGHYYSLDLSEKTVELCNRLLAYAEERGILNKKSYEVKCGNFFNSQIMEGRDKADILTMFEVLEHVPNPDEMLERIKDVTTGGAQIFLSTPINEPAPGHIYLFKNIQDVLDLVERHGFVIENKVCAAAGGIELEIAEKRELPITIALRLKKAEGV